MKIQDLMLYAQGDLSTLLYEWRDNNYLMKILPEIALADEVVHNPLYHPEGCTNDSYGTALDHIIESVKCADRLSYTPEEKMCVLFHDVGKYKSSSGYTNERPYHNCYAHEYIGLHVMNCLSKRLNVSDELMYKICHCIKNHMRFNKILEMRKHKVLNLVNHPLWELLKKVALCDDMSRGYLYKEEEFIKKVNYAEGLCQRI